MKVLGLLAAGAAAFALAVGGALVLFSLMTLGADVAESEATDPSSAALGDVPHDLLRVYREAAGSCGMEWPVLAAVGKIESNHGRSNSAGVRSGTNGAGAMGPMQFLAGTWAAYGVDADHDGAIDVYDPVDAIWGAARYLCANGASDPARVRSALWRYNRSNSYVEQVLKVAADYRATDVIAADGRDLVNNSRLTLTPRARRDLLDGIIGRQVVDFLAWAVSRHAISVSVLRTGHSKYVADTDRISLHWHGRGVDIYAVDGELVTSTSEASRRFAIEAVRLGHGRPDEIGVPWTELADARGVFADGDHRHHLHFGWSHN